MLTLPTDFSTTFLAQVGNQITDPGTLAVIAIVIALPLTFWVVKRIIGLVPKGK